MKKKKPARASNPSKRPKKPDAKVGDAPPDSTVVWDRKMEQGDFIKVPRTLCYLGRYDPEFASELRPRHLLLLLNLAARKFKGQANRAYWVELACDMGTKPATVRKWAYELEKMGLLKIKRHKGRASVEGKPGVKNDRNTFDFAPFVERLGPAFANRVQDRDRRGQGQKTNNGDERL